MIHIYVRPQNVKQSNTVLKLFELLTLLVGSVKTQFVRQSTNLQTLKVLTAYYEENVITFRICVCFLQFLHTMYQLHYQLRQKGICSKSADCHNVFISD